MFASEMMIVTNARTMEYILVFLERNRLELVNFHLNWTLSVYQINIFSYWHIPPKGYMGWVTTVSATRLRSTIINTILSIFTVFSLYVYTWFNNSPGNSSWSKYKPDLLIILSVSLFFTVMLTSIRKLLSNIDPWSMYFIVYADTS